MTAKTSPSSNIYLFYGEDDFSLRRRIEIWKTEFAKKYSPQAISFFDGSELSETELIKQLQNQFAPSLFSSKKLIIIRDGLPMKATQTALIEFVLGLPGTVSPDFFVVFWQTQRLDGRLGFTKKFLSSGITATEFNLPHGTALNQWIQAMAKTLGSSITARGADLLAQFLGRDLYEEKKAGGRVIERKEAFDLWQAYSELTKLSAYSSEITDQAVSALVRPKVPDSVFSLSDGLISGSAKAAFEALENYLQSASGDEKSAFIKITGLLAEQFRSLLLVSLLVQENYTNDQMADRLGWSTGRIFILSKHARSFKPTQLKRMLADLLVIDTALKSSSTSPRLLLDLFITNSAQH